MFRIWILTTTILVFASGYSPFKYLNSNKRSTSTLQQKLSVDSSSGGSSPFQVVYQWKYLDFEYPTYEERQKALISGKFDPETNLPLGIEITNDRLFITTPRWKDGVPSSLGWLPLPAKELSPPIKPYPNWEEHGDPYNPDCTKLMSVYRLNIDDCGRLWVIDSGVVNATVSLNQICPPKIVVYDLSTDEKILSYEFPPDQVKQDSLHSNIVVDIQGEKCNNAHVYVTDVWRFGIVVYSLAKNRSWRVTSNLFYSDPIASDFNLYGLNFQWSDGVFGLSLSPETDYGEKIVFYHPMASYKEFMVSNAILKDENLWTVRSGTGAAKSFQVVGDRGSNGQSSTSSIDRNQVMFFTLVHLDAIGCWDTRKSYTRANIGVAASNLTEIMFPNDLKVDHEANQGVWVISNRLPIYLYSQLDFSDVNFHILRATAKEVIRGSICDPLVPQIATVTPVTEECY